MRTNGVPEHYITGDASDWEKFEKWAETVPQTVRNPLYHWTHLELQRYFGITELLNPASARRIYEQCNALLQTPAYSVRNLLRRINVEALCTTDDPADSLEHHRALQAGGFEIQVLPTFRPDKAMAVEDAATYNAYLDKLGQSAAVDIQTYHDLQASLRNNNNSRMLRQLGPDTGWDSIGDFSQARALARFLDSQDKLAKTILYNLNPADNELLATMVGNFNDGSVAGKVQFGSGWWFLDQKEGMEKQLNALSNMGLLSRFVGMRTDSRSFLSYPRHEYFCRVLCNLLGENVENGELPADLDLLGGIVQNICYHNAKAYFGFANAPANASSVAV